MTQMCQDEKMIKAYQEGKDLYAEIASLSFNKPYEDCLEFYLDENGNKTEEVNEEGKERRSQAKSILLGVLYGRGIASIAEQLNTTYDNAKKIRDAVFKGFPAIPKFEEDSLRETSENGFTTTLWGRKRRLPDLQLDDYDYVYTNSYLSNIEDLLDFSGEDEEFEVPESTKIKYDKLLMHAKWRDKPRIIEQANKEGIEVIDNTYKKGKARRQCVNARIQGSAADMTKLAMILIGNDKKLKEWGFRLLIQVHDELIGECPKENAEKCKKRFSMLMSEAAKDKLHIPINCDVTVTDRWYGVDYEFEFDEEED